MQAASRRAEASVSSRSLQSLFFLTLITLTAAQSSQTSATSTATPSKPSQPSSIWAISIDNSPAPAPADGPALSYNAVRDTAYLPVTIIAVVGSYLITVIVVCAILLILARRLRRQRAAYQPLPSSEPARLRMIGTRDNKDVHVDIKGIEEPPRTPFWKMGGRKNSVQEQDSAFEIKHVTFDNAVQASMDAERSKAHAQQNEFEMSQLYAAVMRHETGLESQQTRKNSTTPNGYSSQTPNNGVSRPEHIYNQHSRRPSPPQNYEQQQVSSSGRPFVYPAELAHLRPATETATRPPAQRTNSAGLPSSPAPAANGITTHPYAKPASPGHVRSSSGASSPGRGSRRPTPLNLNGSRQQSAAYMNDPTSPPIPPVPSAQAAVELERQRYTSSPPRSDNSSRGTSHSYAHSISQTMTMGASGVARGYDDAMYGETVPLHNQYQNGSSSRNDFSNQSSNTMVNNTRRPSNGQQVPPTPSWRDDPRSAAPRPSNFSKPLPPISRYAEEPTTPIDEDVPGWPSSARPQVQTFAQAQIQKPPQVRFEGPAPAANPTTFQRPKKFTPAPLNLASNSNNTSSLSATQRDATLSSTGFASLPFRTQFGNAHSAPATTTLPLASPGLPLRHPLSPTRPMDASTPMTATPMKSPGLKQTILNLKPKKTDAFVPNTAGLMVPNTAGIYSPYMPMTPMTPMTPSRLVGREERRKAEKERRKREEVQLVVPEEDAWE